MGLRFWVGGTATWDATAGTKWATTSGGAGGAAVPTSADDVYLDAASGAVTVTVSGSQTPKSLNCTGFTGTLTGTGSIETIGGDFTLSSGMTIGSSIVLQVKALPAGGSTITTAGKSLYSLQITINNNTDIVQFADALTADNFVLAGCIIKLKSGTVSTVGTLYDTSVFDYPTVLTATTTSAATLSVASGNVNIRYATISYSTATGGATFTAGPGATDGGNNTGWTFLSGGTPLFELGAF